jgi:hypothetical protein
VTFERDVQPVLTRAGCNAGACHGKARGQEGFALSLLAFDPEFDYRAVAKEGLGRRLSPSDPDNSLLLLKASGAVPHGGGNRLARGTDKYETVRRWVAAGAPRTPTDAPALTRVSLSTTQITAGFRRETPLRVFAHYADGTRDDVTELAAFQSNESGYAAVTADGVVRAGAVAGEAAVTARFRDKFAVCHVLIPHPDVPDPETPPLPRRNGIDGHVWDKLRGARPHPVRPGQRRGVPPAGVPRHHRPAADGGTKPGRSWPIRLPTNATR